MACHLSIFHRRGNTEINSESASNRVCKWIFALSQLQLKKGQLDFSSEKLDKRLAERCRM